MEEKLAEINSNLEKTVVLGPLLLRSDRIIVSQMQKQAKNDLAVGWETKQAALHFQEI